MLTVLLVSSWIKLEDHFSFFSFNSVCIVYLVLEIQEYLCHMIILGMYIVSTVNHQRDDNTRYVYTFKNIWRISCTGEDKSTLLIRKFSFLEIWNLRCIILHFIKADLSCVFWPFISLKLLSFIFSSSWKKYWRNIFVLNILWLNGPLSWTNNNKIFTTHIALINSNPIQMALNNILG